MNVTTFVQLMNNYKGRRNKIKDKKNNKVRNKGRKKQKNEIIIKK